ncbi:MAG: hypothetical protein PHX51_01310 [Clostridia bacterium]|nr:hypothetical protein [Clostridia bacterium]
MREPRKFKSYESQKKHILERNRYFYDSVLSTYYGGQSKRRIKLMYAVVMSFLVCAIVSTSIFVLTFQSTGNTTHTEQYAVEEGTRLSTQELFMSSNAYEQFNLTAYEITHVVCGFDCKTMDELWYSVVLYNTDTYEFIELKIPTNKNYRLQMPVIEDTERYSIGDVVVDYAVDGSGETIAARVKLNELEASITYTVCDSNAEGKFIQFVGSIFRA